MDQRALHSFEKLIRLTIDIPPGSAPAPFQPQPFLDQLSAYVTLQRVRKGHTIIRASQVLQDLRSGKPIPELWPELEYDPDNVY